MATINRVIVVFRTYPDGAVDALFPDVEHGTRGLCLCYSDREQHCAAHYGAVIERTRPSTLAELTPLRQELERLDYHLRVRRKYRPARK